MGFNNRVVEILLLIYLIVIDTETGKTGKLMEFYATYLKKFQSIFALVEKLYLQWVAKLLYSLCFY